MSAVPQVLLAADGSFTFNPNVDWVGSTSFTYRAFDGLNSSANAAVSLNREIAVPTARYINGTWTFSGMGAINGKRIEITRDRGNSSIADGNSGAATRPTVSGNAWSFTRTGGPGFNVGDTVTIQSCSGGNPDSCNGGNTSFVLAAVPVLAGAADDVLSTAHVQCPLDANNDGLISDPEAAAGRAMNPAVVCKHLGAGDGWIVMADDERAELYTFGFNDLTKVTANKAIAKGILNAHFPAPTLDFDEGDEIYLTLTNVGMLQRPDLFDPHSVHFHGFPNAAAVFDGVPEASITINMGFSFTYYYKTLDPGTYMYHCHVEAAEHMQMGMLGNLYVRPRQNKLTNRVFPNGFVHVQWNPITGAGNKYAYNDGDGSTYYDVEFPIQIGSMDRNFHEQHIGVQPLPFAEMHDDYPMLNGRGYPDTVDTGNLPVAESKSDPALGIVSGSESSQQMNTRIVIPHNKKALLRISNLNVTRFYTLTTNGLPMQVIGTGAHILRGPGGANLYYTTNSVTLGGGESADVLIDANGVAAGTYLLYSTNLEALSNGAEDFGGMMTEIVIQ
jgi:FtsP/CotA-like multicopper oxidase with cupredoxin domain